MDTNEYTTQLYRAVDRTRATLLARKMKEDATEEEIDAIMNEHIHTITAIIRGAKE